MVDETTRQIVTVVAGHSLRLALGLLSSALLARGLGPDGLSLFSVIGATALIGRTVADFGLSQSGVRQISADLATCPPQARRTYSAFAWLKLTGSVLITALTLLLAGPLAGVVNAPSDSGPFLIRLATLGVLAAGLGGVVSTPLQALRRFRVLVLTETASIVVIIGLVGVLLFTGALDVPSALVVGAVAALVTACFNFLALPRDWRQAAAMRTGPLQNASRALLAFGGWLWVSSMLSILLSQLDLLLLNRLMDAGTVGLYALALNLAVKADFFRLALHTVLLPLVSGHSSAAAFRQYARHSFARGAVLAGVLVSVTPLIRPFVLAVYGPAYAPSIPILYGLLGVVLLDLLTWPILLLAFPMNIPRWMVAADVVRVVVLFALGRALIPGLGVYGAVAAKLCATVAGALVLGGVIARRLGHDSAVAPAAPGNAP
jgi:PST family polysaccharide transporter